jgi:tetratricopeptide (TPR) repeat protein
MVEYRLGHYGVAHALANERLKLALERNHLPEQAHAWNSIGLVTNALGQLDEATEAYLRSRELYRVTGSRRGEVIALYNIAGIYIDQGQLNLAEQYIEQYLALSRSTGNRLAEAYAPLTRSTIANLRGQFDEAESQLNLAREAAQQNHWPALVNITAMTWAESMFERWLVEGTPHHLEQSLQGFATAEANFADEIGPNSYAYLIAARMAAGQDEAARAACTRLVAMQDDSWVIDAIWVRLAQAVIAGQPLEPLRQEFLTYHMAPYARFVERLQNRL